MRGSLIERQISAARPWMERREPYGVHFSVTWVDFGSASLTPVHPGNPEAAAPAPRLPPAAGAPALASAAMGVDDHGDGGGTAASRGPDLESDDPDAT